jgi:hypothetical protein
MTCAVVETNSVFYLSLCTIDLKGDRMNRFPWLLFLGILALTLDARIAYAAILHNVGGGGAGFRMEYAIGGNTTRTSNLNPLDLAVSQQGANITAHAGGSWEVTARNARNLVDLSSLSISTDGTQQDSTRANMGGTSSGAFFVEYQDSDLGSRIPGFGLCVVTTEFEWEGGGSIAAGGSVGITLSNALLINGTPVADSDGHVLVYSTNFSFDNTNGTEAMSFGFGYHFTSAPWNGGQGGAVDSIAGFSFAISHKEGTVGTSSVGLFRPRNIYRCCDKLRSS